MNCSSPVTHGDRGIYFEIKIKWGYYNFFLGERRLDWKVWR